MITFHTIKNKFPEFKFLECDTIPDKYNTVACAAPNWGIAYFKPLFKNDKRFVPCIIHELCHLTAKPLNRKFIFSKFDVLNFIESIQKSIEFNFACRQEKNKPFKYFTKKELVEVLHEEFSTSLAAQLIFEIYSLNRYYNSHEQSSLEGHMTRFYDSEILKGALKEINYNLIKQEALRIVNYFSSRLK